jgi:hypothetical protein
MGDKKKRREGEKERRREGEKKKRREGGRRFSSRKERLTKLGDRNGETESHKDS